MKKADIGIALIMACVGGAALITATEYPEETRMLPTIYSCALIALSAALGFSAFFKKNPDAAKEASGKEPLPKVLLVMFLIFGYIASVQVLGFYSSTALFLLIFMGILKAARWHVTVLISLLVPLSIYLFFSLLLKIPVPAGLFF